MSRTPTYNVSMIRCNLSIPVHLRTFAEEKGINISAVLQEALQFRYSQASKPINISERKAKLLHEIQQIEIEEAKLKEAEQLELEAQNEIKHAEGLVSNWESCKKLNRDLAKSVYTDLCNAKKVKAGLTGAGPDQYDLLISEFNRRNNGTDASPPRNTPAGDVVRPTSSSPQGRADAHTSERSGSEEKKVIA